MTDEEIVKLANIRIFRLSPQESKKWGGEWGYEFSPGFFVQGFKTRENVVKRILDDLFGGKHELANLCYDLLKKHDFLGKLPKSPKKSKTTSTTTIRA